MFYTFVVAIFFMFFKICFRLKIYGREDFPKEGRLIVASNHVSFFDPIIVAISASRKMNFIARDTLFRPKVFAKILQMLQVFPIKREGSDLGAFKFFLSKLLNDEVVFIFPEGTRSKDGNLQRPKHGIGFLQVSSDARVLPCYVKGSNEALPRGAGFPNFRNPISVYFGKPIAFEKTFSGDKRKHYTHIAEKTMEAIKGLKENAD